MQRRRAATVRPQPAGVARQRQLKAGWPPLLLLQLQMYSTYGYAEPGPTCSRKVSSSAVAAPRDSRYRSTQSLAATAIELPYFFTMSVGGHMDIREMDWGNHRLQRGGTCSAGRQHHDAGAEMHRLRPLHT